MSVEAITWAMRFSINPPGRKFCLVVLANFADEHASCYPGQEYLAEATGQSERAVRGHLAALESAGFIRRVARRTRGGVRTSDRFYLNLDTRPGPLISRLPPGDPNGTPTEKPRIDKRAGDAPENPAYPTGQAAESAGRPEQPEQSDSQAAESADGNICRPEPAESAGYTKGVYTDDDDAATPPIPQPVDNPTMDDLMGWPCVRTLADHLASATQRPIIWNLDERELMALDARIRGVGDTQLFVDAAVGQDEHHADPGVTARAYVRAWMRLRPGRVPRPAAPLDRPKAPHCGHADCDPITRFRDMPEGDVQKCPACHPDVLNPAF